MSKFINLNASQLHTHTLASGRYSRKELAAALAAHMSGSIQTANRCIKHGVEVRHDAYVMFIRRAAGYGGQQWYIATHEAGTRDSA
jgi:adenylyl- and sulfurtransferase ThiI